MNLQTNNQKQKPENRFELIINVADIVKFLCITTVIIISIVCCSKLLNKFLDHKSLNL